MTEYQLLCSERRMGAVDTTSEGIYDRVVGKVVDQEYEKVRRQRAILMIGQHAETIARKLIWC